MSEEVVRVLKNFKGMEFESVPRSEVPQGYLQITVQGHGLFFADPAALKSGGEPRHDPFSPDVRAELARLYAVLSGVYTVTEEEWEEGFRRDAYPWKELAIWDFVATALQRFAGHLTGDSEAARDARQHLFQVLLNFVNSGVPPASPRLRFAGYKTVTANRVREIHGFLVSDEARQIRAAADEKYRDLFRAEVRAVSLPDRVTIDALFGDGNGPNEAATFDVRECVRSADIIFGEDVATGNRFLAYGRDALQRIIGTGAAEECRTLTVEVDQETDELEKLLGVVVALRGRHDYQSSGGPGG